MAFKNVADFTSEIKFGFRKDILAVGRKAVAVSASRMLVKMDLDSGAKIVQDFSDFSAMYSAQKSKLAPSDALNDCVLFKYHEGFGIVCQEVIFLWESFQQQDPKVLRITNPPFPDRSLRGIAQPGGPCRALFVAQENNLYVAYEHASFKGRVLFISKIQLEGPEVQLAFVPHMVHPTLLPQASLILKQLDEPVILDLAWWKQRPHLLTMGGAYSTKLKAADGSLPAYLLELDHQVQAVQISQTLPGAISNLCRISTCGQFMISASWSPKKTAGFYFVDLARVQESKILFGSKEYTSQLDHLGKDGNSTKFCAFDRHGQIFWLSTYEGISAFTIE